MARVKRIAIPLVMIPGNMEIMLENMIPCNGISLMPYKGNGNDSELPEGLAPDEDAVVIVLHGADAETVARLGFQTTPKGD